MDVDVGFLFARAGFIVAEIKDAEAFVSDGKRPRGGEGATSCCFKLADAAAVVAVLLLLPF